MLLLVLASIISQPATFAVYAVPDASLQERQFELLKTQLVVELEKHQGVHVVQQTTDGTSGENEECAERRSCLVRLAETIGAQEVVLMRTSLLGDTHHLSLKRLSLQTGEITHSAERNFVGGDGESYLHVLGDVIAQLVPDHLVDAPYAIGVPPEVIKRWSVPPLPPAAFWGSTSASLASAAVGGFFAVRAHQLQNDYDKLAKSATKTPVDGRLLVKQGDRMEFAARSANISFAVAGALVLTTAIVYLFTDFGSDEKLAGPE